MIEQEQWYDFDGDDDCEDCRGRDGIENRCDCGNRRVNWECMKSKCECKNNEDCMKCEHAYASAY